jgi:hypothetical protein
VKEKQEAKEKVSIEGMWVIRRLKYFGWWYEMHCYLQLVKI